MILPAQFANEVREENEILFCPYCSRILRWQESKDGEEETYYTIDTAGSLADLDDDDLLDDNDDDDDIIEGNDGAEKDDDLLDDEEEIDDSDEEESEE